jgi:hypothetical protein
MKGAVLSLHIGHTRQVEEFRAQALSGDVHLLIVILLQGADIGDLGNAALSDDAHITFKNCLGFFALERG